MAEDLSFYETYKTYRGVVIHETILCTVLRIILQIIGIFGNFTVAYTTLKYKHLRGTCGTLLSLCAISDSLHQLSHDYFGYLMLTGINFTDLKTCVFINILPVIGLNSGMMFTLFIGIDRLLSVTFPVWHRKVNRISYIAFYILVDAIVCGYFTITSLVEAFKNPDLDTICLISDAMPNYVGNTWFLFCLVMSLVTMLCYVVVWITLKMHASTLSSTRRMFKSLFAITLVVFFGWMVNAGANVLTASLHVNKLDSWFIGFYIGIVINVACSCSFFLLYAFSNDYRFAFRKELNLIGKGITGRYVFEKETTVKPVTRVWTSSHHN